MKDKMAPKSTVHWLYRFCGYFALASLWVAPAGAQANEETITYEYDASGRLSKATYANGMGFFYAYDSAGNRIVERQLPPGSEPGQTPSGFEPLLSLAELEQMDPLAIQLRFRVTGSEQQSTSFYYEVYLGDAPSSMVLLDTTIDSFLAPFHPPLRSLSLLFRQMCRVA